ncbi:MAG: methyltransferase domain-containing protein [Acidimicrobiia bacterium]|nr:methyltransferase domain-containing protein [Acidimicrobiia bacterium]
MSDEGGPGSGDRYAGFPAGFFDRADRDDARFYGVARIVTHIDDAAIAEVGALYTDLGLDEGEVLDLMSSWVSHFERRPRRLVALGMNAEELAANEDAHERRVHDLNAEPRLPFPDASFDAVVCCVSVDYLVRPIEVFDEAARVLRTGGPFVCTFSNRCFPTKAIRGWLGTDDGTHIGIVGEYFRRSVGWTGLEAEHRNAGRPGDPLYAVWARRA